MTCWHVASALLLVGGVRRPDDAHTGTYVAYISSAIGCDSGPWTLGDAWLGAPASLPADHRVGRPQASCHGVSHGIRADPMRSSSKARRRLWYSIRRCDIICTTCDVLAVRAVPLESTVVHSNRRPRGAPPDVRGIGGLVSTRVKRARSRHAVFEPPSSSCIHMFAVERGIASDVLRIARPDRLEGHGARAEWNAR